jgi:menaquinone-specific isochorismate synthase
MSADLPPTLVVRTVHRHDSLPLSDALSGDVTGAWTHSTDGLVGVGAALLLPLRNGLEEAADIWRRIVGSAAVDDQVCVEGSGLVGFVSAAFDGEGGRLVVPARILGQRDGVAFETTIESGIVREAAAPTGPGAVSVVDGAVDSAEWRCRVADASARIRTGALAKVVLARSVVATTENPIDLRWLALRLAESYPDCWTYLVGPLVGATPELLVRLRDGVAESRVLAGTVARGEDAAEDEALAEWLLASAKDLEEHEYAVQSVTERLAPLGELQVTGPSLLTLPNVRHLATDVRVAVTGRSVLDLAAALHPSAAVCGTPREAALALIDEIEGMGRGVYAGGVGWIDAAGDGEIGIALRCGVRTGERELTAYAGGGIMADSIPAAELAETEAKLRPVLRALQSQGPSSLRGRRGAERGSYGWWQPPPR